MAKGKKKKGKKRKSKKAIGPPVHLFRDNYKIICKLLGEQPEPTIMTQLDELAEDVKSNYNKMQYSDIDLGPSGTRCIAEALLAEFPSMEGGPFINLNSLCLWSCNVQDYGAVAIAKYLRNCPSVQLRMQPLVVGPGASAMSEEAEKPKEMSALEKEMQALLSGASGVINDTKSAQGVARNVRRKSKDLEESLDKMAQASDQWQSLGGRRSRRGSRDYSDDALKKAFDVVDADKSGFIDHKELKAAIKEMDPNCSQATIQEMMDFADKDGDGKCDFEEFKKIMLYKPSKAGAPEAAPA